MDTITIYFVQSHENLRRDVLGGKTVSGRFAEEGGAPNESNNLGEVNDMHPGFVDHIVRAVNTYSAIRKIIEAEGGRGPVSDAIAAYAVAKLSG